MSDEFVLTAAVLEQWRADAKRLEQPGARSIGNALLGNALLGRYEASQRMLRLIDAVAVLWEKCRSYEREHLALVADHLESGNRRAALEREVEALQVQLNRYALAIETNEPRLAELNSERQRREQVERAWATDFIERYGNTVEDHWGEGMPWSVVALVREHAGKPIGECDRCGQRAPLVDEIFDERTVFDNATRKVCAWEGGCSAGRGLK